MKSNKQKICKNILCKKPFTPKQFGQVVCDWKCGLERKRNDDKKKARDAEKAERKKLKERKEKLKTHSDYMKILQPIFNQYIRLRDAKEPCICCGAVGDYMWDAGHYLTKGSHPWLAVNEDNVHKQRSRPCNNDRSGNQAAYRIRLIEKIGLERVEALENCHDREKLSIDEIKEKTKYYRQKVKELKDA